jgi:2-oxoglutarate ferredoxin oxidoreductase subunit beta
MEQQEPKLVFEAPESLCDRTMHYCPGCTHGIIHRLVAEVIDDLGIRERAVGIAPVGCAVYMYHYFHCDFIQAAHGRAPAVATGLSRALPDSVIFTYQGDGDLAAIGAGEIIHAAARNERIAVIFVNNAVYGMTQGQCAPTTLLGQRTTTSPRGRSLEAEGHPIRVSELLSSLDGPLYVARATTTSAKHVRQAKRFMRRAFEAPTLHGGFGFVELLSTCPTFWGQTPRGALTWLEDNMIPQYPLGELVNKMRIDDGVTDAGEEDAEHTGEG